MSDMWDAPVGHARLRQGAAMATLTLAARPLLHAITPHSIDSGDTAWLLAASALVLLMAPGLALFYGGMVRSKSVLNMMMMTFGALAAITVLWVVVGYSLAFGDDLGLGLLGNPLDHLGLQDLVSESADSWLTVPVILFAVFQGLFCVITGALVSGAIADRARFGAWIVFVSVWTLLVYAPVAHWVFDLDHPGHTGRLAGQPHRDHRLRRRHGGGDLLRCQRARARHGGRHPRRVRPGRDAPAQPDPGDARRRAALVRLVRLQRGLRPGRQPRRGRGVRDHHLRRSRRRHRLAGPGARSATGTPRPWAPRRGWSPGWSRSPRAAGRSRRSVRWSWAWRRAWSARWPSG